MTDTGEDTGIDRRRDKRVDIHRGASLLADGTVHDCAVINISPSGARVRTEGRLGLHDRVVLELPGFGEAPARVARITSDGYGVEFTYGADERKVMIEWLSLAAGY